MASCSNMSAGSRDEATSSSLLPAIKDLRAFILVALPPSYSFAAIILKMIKVINKFWIKNLEINQIENMYPNLQHQTKLLSPQEIC